MRAALGRLQPRITLKVLIVLLSVLSVIIVAGSILTVSFQLGREVLVKDALNYNAAYARKMASTIERFLDSAERRLAFAANDIGTHFHDVTLRDEKVRHLKQQDDSFNSVLLVSHTGQVLASEPELGLLGDELTSINHQLMQERRAFLISAPYVAATGRLVLTLSHPVFDEQRNYLGYLVGAIYLQEPSVLNRMLADHFYQDDSYVYVVDSEGRLIHHPQVGRVGEVIIANPLVSSLVAGIEREGAVTNSQGITMLAASALVPEVGWGVVAQVPAQSRFQPLRELTGILLYYSLPLFVILGVLIWYFSSVITRPLRRLADVASIMDEAGSIDTIKAVPAWYFEATRLKGALLLGVSLVQKQIGHLQSAAHTDPLTSLLNRRAFDNALQELQTTETEVALLALDIDHFKKVNDEYGHDVGDRVLTQLAQVMQSFVRPDDLVFRTGGEEFAVLVPEMTASEACKMAERLRLCVAQAEMPSVGYITVSIGVARCPAHVENVANLPKQADLMLYRAKSRGRNRVEMV